MLYLLLSILEFATLFFSEVIPRVWPSLPLGYGPVVRIRRSRDGSGQENLETRQDGTGTMSWIFFETRQDEKSRQDNWIQDNSRKQKACRDKTRLLSSQKTWFETRQDFCKFQNFKTRRDETAFPVSSRREFPGNKSRQWNFKLK